MRVTVSGSFRRHMAAIYDAVVELADYGAEVLSPADPRVVDQIGEFVFVASDQVRSIKMVEDRHLECIQASDFLWLVTPDGYVGQSASMELGYAIAHNIPIYSSDELNDGTLRKYVELVPSVAAAVGRVLSKNSIRSDETFLIRPFAAIDIAHDHLERMRRSLSQSRFEIGDREGECILRERDSLTKLLVPSTAPRRIKSVA